MVACRRMALAALHFPEARTLDVSEQDPFRGSPAMSQAPRQAAAGYDPAAVAPAAAAMLRRGWLDVTTVVCGGWLPLLMRCLGCADDAIRCSPRPRLPYAWIAADCDCSVTVYHTRFAEPFHERCHFSQVPRGSFLHAIRAMRQNTLSQCSVC